MLDTCARQSMDRGLRGGIVQELPYIVEEFPDVFSDELPWIAPDREVEFSINLLLGTLSIFTPSYMMQPTKLTKLHR